MQVRRENVLVLAPRLPLAAAAWAVLIWQAGMMAGMGLTMGLGIVVFLAVWVVMMVAMMFPATAPMNLAFALVQRERGSFGRVFVSSWIFMDAYPAFLDALRGAGLPRRQRRLGADSNRSLAHEERDPHRWWPPRRGWTLPVHAFQTRLPGEMLQARAVHS
jgi:predicted metal-binding membrane protein